MSTTSKLTAKKLRDIARQTIEYDTSYDIEKILECDPKLGKSKILCRSQFGVDLTLEVLVKNGILTLQAPGMGTLLVKRINF